MGRFGDNGKTFADDFAKKDWRKCEVTRTGLDPEGEAELHERVAAQKLLDLTREWEEAAKAARAAEAAAAAAAAEGEPAAAAPEGEPAAGAGHGGNAGEV